MVHVKDGVRCFQIKALLASKWPVKSSTERQSSLSTPTTSTPRQLTISIRHRAPQPAHTLTSCVLPSVPFGASTSPKAEGPQTHLIHPFAQPSSGQHSRSDIIWRAASEHHRCYLFVYASIETSAAPPPPPSPTRPIHFAQNPPSRTEAPSSRWGAVT